MLPTTFYKNLKNPLILDLITLGGVTIIYCWCYKYTLPETNTSPLQGSHPKRKLVFQPSIFRCYVSFREGVYIYIFIYLSIYLFIYTYIYNYNYCWCYNYPPGDSFSHIFLSVWCVYCFLPVVAQLDVCVGQTGGFLFASENLKS